MDGLIIYEIPIYAMPEAKFNKKWEQKLKNEVDEFVSHGHECNKAEQLLRQIYGAKLHYKYNQIVGYIVVVKENSDISFELYISENKQYRYDTPRQNNIRHSTQVGQHFYIQDNWDNNEIANEIWLWLKSEEKYQKEHGRYLDLTLFETTYKHLDYKAIFAKVKEQSHE